MPDAPSSACASPGARQTGPSRGPCSGTGIVQHAIVHYDSLGTSWILREVGADRPQDEAWLPEGITPTRQ